MTAPASAQPTRDQYFAHADPPGVEQLAALEPPTADAQLIGSWVRDLRAQVPLGNRVATALIHDRLPLRSLNRLGKLKTVTQGLVATLGFHSCQDL